MQKFLLVILLLTTAAKAQNITLESHNYVLNDIKKLGITKEALFRKMDRSFIKLGGSICANRAQMWTYDFKRFQNVDSAKMFLFYTKKTGEGTTKTWWYHVTPMVNEAGKMWALDAGFPRIKGPLEPMEWLNYFAGSKNCREIQDTDTELIELMFKGRTFPENTVYGKYDCYYRIVPAPYWFPSSIATHLLGRDAQGRPARLERNEFNRGEVYQACIEAVTGSLGRFFGGGKKKCQEWLNQ
jgi:hypothetical protein